MGAFFQNGAFVYVHDTVRIFDGGQPVGDNKRSASYKQTVQALLEQDFRFGVDT